MFNRLLKNLLAVLVWGVSASAIAGASMTGVGASFPFPIYAKWAAQYHQETGGKVNYQSIGSGGGQQQIITGTVDFGASDDPMSGEMLSKHGLVQFPAVIGGTVPVINIDGIAPGALRLSGTVLADIFLGEITRWNDPAIQAINPDLNLPDHDIIVVHRADGSGTTFGWTNYLSKVSDTWKNQVGEGKAVKWPVGQGGKGNEGVAAYVKQLSNSIGYVEYAYAKQNHLSWTQLQNHDGVFVQPNPETFSAAAANADWGSVPGMGVVLTNEPGAQSWPLTSASFILMRKSQRRPDTGREVLAFFDWVFRQGDTAAHELDYVPVPVDVEQHIRNLWSTEIHAADGTAVWQ